MKLRKRDIASARQSAAALRESIESTMADCTVPGALEALRDELDSLDRQIVPGAYLFSVQAIFGHIRSHAEWTRKGLYSRVERSCGNWAWHYA